MQRRLMELRWQTIAMSAVLYLMAFSNPAAAQVKRAVILAPAAYAGLPASPLHQRSAELLRRRLLRSGYDAEHIALLHDPQASANAAAFRRTLITLTNEVRSSDLLLVVVCSYGIHVGGTDYILAADASLEQLQAIQSKPDTTVPSAFVAIQDIVDLMSRAPTSRQCLLVDGVCNHDAVAATSTRFGQQAITTDLDGQCIVVNQSPQIWKADEADSAQTFFSRAIHEGLVGHADLNRDNQVSLLELTDYINLYGEEVGFRRPQQYGKARVDIVLADVNQDPDDPGRLPQQLRQRLANQLLKSATTSLLLEDDVEGARRAIDRAALYSAGSELQTEIEMMALTVRASEDVDLAVAESKRRDLPLLVLARKPLELMHGRDVVGRVEAGQLMRIGRKQNNWLEVTQLYTVQHEQGELDLVAAAATGYVNQESLKVDVTAAARLVERLRSNQDKAQLLLYKAHQSLAKSDLEAADDAIRLASQLRVEKPLEAEIEAMRLSILAATDVTAALQQAKDLDLPLRVYLRRSSQLRQRSESTGSVSPGEVLRISTAQDKWLWATHRCTPKFDSGRLIFTEDELKGWFESSIVNSNRSVRVRR